MNIHKIEKFMGPNGESVDMMTLINSETGERVEGEEDSVVFVGTGRVGISFVDEMGQEHRDMQTVPFTIDASSLEEAFHKFEPELESFLEQAREASNRPKVVVPGDIPGLHVDDDDSPNIIM